MTKRIRQLFVTFAALTALALGGAVFANAQTSHTAKHEKTTAVDTDNIQSGDQTTPDAAKKVKHAAADPAGGGAGQSGSQTAPDTGSVSETAGEAPASETGPSDGPGGHADAAGTAVDHQFQGVE